MAFLPDTNLWISLLKNPGGKLDAMVQSQPAPDILLCAVVKAELWHGAEKYGNRLEVQGRVLGPNDLKIAAIARTHGLTLVSADREFSPVPGLSVEDWTQG